MVNDRTLKIILGFAIYILFWAVTIHEGSDKSILTYEVSSLYIFAAILFGLFYWLYFRLLPETGRYAYFWTIGILYAGILLAITTFGFWFSRFFKYILRNYAFPFAFKHNLDLLLLIILTLISSAFFIPALIIIFRTDYQHLIMKLQNSLTRIRQ